MLRPPTRDYNWVHCYMHTTPIDFNSPAERDEHDVEEHGHLYENGRVLSPVEMRQRGYRRNAASRFVKSRDPRS